MPPRVEDEVRVQVHVAIKDVHVGDAAAAGERPAGPARVLVAADAVLLHAEGVHAEEEGAAPVVVGVEKDLDLVVAADVVAVGAGGADHVAVGLVRADAEVDRGGAVPDEHLGPLLGGPRVHRLVLREAGEVGGAGPHGLVEHAVHHDRLLEAGDADVELALAAVVHRAAVRGGLGGEGEEGEGWEHRRENLPWVLHTVTRNTVFGSAQCADAQWYHSAKGSGVSRSEVNVD